ncbi:MAG: cbb3-type cytochrome c oxidase N-terminal domain-containing protein [Bacteroidota bacterium]
MKTFRYTLSLITLLTLLATPTQVWAEAQPALAEKTTVIYVLVGMLLFVLLAIAIVAAFMWRVIWLMSEQQAARTGAEPQESWWIRLKKKHITGDLAPVEHEQAMLLDHNYDGIHELDNHMPPWLKYLFLGSIAFAAIYLVSFAFLGLVKTSEQEYVAEMTEAQKQIDAYQLVAAEKINENNAMLVNDAASLTAAQTIYEQNCRACHGAAGEGGVGPNLTDEYWLHGGEVKEVFKTIKYGVTEKGMIAWQEKLRPDQIQQMASFILSLQGSKPANAKAPQGEKKQAKEISLQ